MSSDPHGPAFKPRLKSALTEKWCRVSDQEFQGLPTGITNTSLLVAVLQSKLATQLTNPALVMIAQLIAMTDNRDWMPPSRPITAPRNAHIYRACNFSQCTFSKVSFELAEAGLLVVRDNPKRVRVAVRGADGAIVPHLSYGFDLSLLAIRYSELVSDALEVAVRRSKRAPWNAAMNLEAVA